MKISIIGTGDMGMNLTKQLALAGYEVFLGSRDPNKVKKQIISLQGNVHGGTNEEAIIFGDIIIPAIPFPQVLDILKQYNSLDDKIVIDITNPVKIELEKNTSAAEEIEKVISNTKIVKAFNTIFTSILKTSPQFGNEKANLFICGNDEESKKLVAEIGMKLGYEPIDVGPLKVARYLESLALFEIHLGKYLNNWEIAFKLLKR